MRFTLRQLAVFDAIAKYGNVSRGADEVALSQSAASMALKELEAGLRMTLFHRSGKQITLNENGRRIQPMVRSLLAQAHEIEQNAPSDEPSGVVRVGAGTSVGPYMLGPACAAFSERFPRARINLHVTVSAEVIRQVESMAYDFGLIESPCNRTTVEVEPLAEDELVVIARPDHPLTARDKASLEDLSRERWCLGEANSFTRQMLTLGLGHLGASIALECNSVAGVKTAVLAGMGLGCISRAAARSELESGELVAVQTEGLARGRKISLIYPKGVQLGPLETGFIASLRATLHAAGYKAAA